MGIFGKVDYTDFKKMQKKLKKLDEKDRAEICKLSAKSLGRSLLAKTKDKTPVGIYPKSSGKVGGTLRRNWESHDQKLVNGYQVNIINETEYASYVEYGHRTRNHKAWVLGRYMLTKSESEVEKTVDKLVNKHLQKALGGLFDDK